jgi:hypothetical protein
MQVQCFTFKCIRPLYASHREVLTLSSIMADLASTTITVARAVAGVAAYINNKLHPESYLAQARDALRDAIKELEDNGQYMDRDTAESLRDTSMK